MEYLVLDTLRERIAGYFRGSYWALSLLDGVYKLLKTVVGPTALGMAAICFFIMMLSKNERAVEQSRALLKRIIIVFVIVLALAFIIRTVLSTVKNL